MQRKHDTLDIPQTVLLLLNGSAEKRGENEKSTIMAQDFEGSLPKKKKKIQCDILEREVEPDEQLFESIFRGNQQS